MKKNKIKEITPSAHRCGVALCPAVFDSHDGKFLIIGKVIEESNIPEEVKKKIGENETVVEVPSALILDLLKENDGK